MKKIKNKRIEIFLRGILNVFKLLGCTILGLGGMTAIFWVLNFLTTISVWLTISFIVALGAAAYILYYYLSTAEILKDFEKERETCMEEVKRCEEELEKHKRKFDNDEEPELYNAHTIARWECHLTGATMRLEEVERRIKNL